MRAAHDRLIVDAVLQAADLSLRLSAADVERLHLALVLRPLLAALEHDAQEAVALRRQLEQTFN